MYVFYSHVPYPKTTFIWIYMEIKRKNQIKLHKSTAHELGN